MSNIINYNINLISIYNFNKIIFNLGKKSHFILKVFRNP